MTKYVRCIITDSANDVRKGEIYEVLEVDNQGFVIIDDAGDQNFLYSYEAEIVSETESESSNPFIKTVTETRIVENSIVVGYNTIEIAPNDDDTISIYLENSSYTKEDVIKIAQILSEIAEAM